MQILLYKNTSETIRVDKTQHLTLLTTLNGYMRANTNVINPSIEIQSTEFITANYAQIPELNRYYFIKNIGVNETGLYVLDLEVDVLMTYRESIGELNAFVAKNDTLDFVKELSEPNYPVENIPTYDRYFEFDFYKFFDPIEEPSDSLYFVLVAITSGNMVHINESENKTYKDGNFEWDISIKDYGNFNQDNRTMQCYIIDMVNPISGEANAEDVVKAIYRDGTQYASGVVKMYLCRKLPPIFTDMLIDIKIGNELLNDGNGTTYKSRVVTSTLLDVGEQIIAIPTPKIYEENQYNFLQYEPYKYRFLYIPRYGEYKIEYNQFKNSLLILRAIFDPTDATLTYLLYRLPYSSRTACLLKTFKVSYGCELPVSSTGVAEYVRQKQANGLNFAASAIGNILGGATGAAHGGVQSKFSPKDLGKSIGKANIATSVVSAAGGLISSGLQYVAQEATNVVSPQTDTIDNEFVSCYAQIESPYMYSLTYKPTISLENYSKLVGLPCNRYGKLNTFTGLTIVGGVHIEDIGTLLETERDMIESLLYSGVIM